MRTRSQIKRYTAFVPKTLRAGKNVGNAAIKEIKYFLRNATKKVKKTTKMIDSRAAKTLRSLTKRRRR